MIIEWLDDVWDRARLVQVVPVIGGGEPLADFWDAGTIAELRALTTTGRFTGDICRCPGSLGLVLYDADAEVVARASVHGHGSVGWERRRFRNDLDVADPAGLHLFLIDNGVGAAPASFFRPLADLLGLDEGHPAGHATPEVRLSPEESAGMLLSRLGRLGVPAEALWGEGVLVRRLLGELPRSIIVDAVEAARTAEVAMGVVNLVMHDGDDGTLTRAVGPVLRELFPG